ncbi:glucan biosynthesis protein D [Pigmentiphaga sp. NML080357]|uniref:glucan biosynthesis protein n=1 Tax=Pigmentiphaga sp. NML080357 TaxID=2008675 RepID=UPI000B41F243|nr:glucan biosynthesis protein D [Pigmentiphaga sp. NML080357]OVZ59116.1 glucan biosynthesis protein D [Pigmentiphaga sp. NML080357]
MTDRRTFLAAMSALAVAALGHAPAAAAAGLKLGRRSPFSFERLREEARRAAQRPFQPVPVPSWPILERLDYAAHGQIRFKPDYALFADGPGQFPVTFFHLGRFSPSPVRMYVLDAGRGQAREIVYDEGYFDMPSDSPAHALPPGIGFAGFRFQESRLAQPSARDWRTNDWVAFLSASYFRAIGELYQYGLSARGIAIDIAVPDRPEEFPAFTHIYFEPPRDGSDTVTVYARLDGPSITGAFRFDMTRGKAVLMDIDASLFLRRDVARLGIAPLTSMYWFSEAQKPTAVDWRPEVHDSDGLAMWTRGGEYIWRPLNNPPRIIASAFSDENPRGFGLLQRDRNFDHYLDGVFYDRRPSLWVEPLGDWGPGTVQLVEIPTDDEIHDNIVAMWVPAAPAAKGSSYRLKYRLHWTDQEPFAPSMARCVATRLGNGGQPGQPRPPGVRKFMVEFLGGPLAQLPYGVKPEPVLWASRGGFSYVYMEAVPDDVPGHWRAQFDLTVQGADPVELRLYLKSGDQTLSETWLYQYHPPANPA